MNEAAGGPLECGVDELRTLFLFEKLTDDQLQFLCDRGRVEQIPPGPVFAEGDPATCFYVLLEGTLVMSRRVTLGVHRAGRVELDPAFAAQPGELGIAQLLEQEQRPQLVGAAGGRFHPLGHSFSR